MSDEATIALARGEILSRLDLSKANTSGLLDRIGDFLRERDEQTTQDERDAGERITTAFYIIQIVRSTINSDDPESQPRCELAEGDLNAIKLCLSGSPLPYGSIRSETDEMRRFSAIGKSVGIEHATDIKEMIVDKCVRVKPHSGT
ncbi:hypothetical protein HDIA_0743 [Hartmannibacter diazotrophicus]|uniref:Uncharacterized protein n=1 Tax=Hartmannibacter diazotrophicus TaxID=1482074 RepID=A0A2C9D222_9HYPH|nr:hypothetical protein [Hartmannibacter diazotrophicus]SON54284.1 hypothetical protein HDIA_0743 [Hartmannibacter diazotrophicus]